MSTLDLIRMLRHTLADARDARDEGAVAELARTLINELNGKIDPPCDTPGIADNPLTDPDEIHGGGMAVLA